MDDTDLTSDRQDQLDALALVGVRNQLSLMEAGQEGDCDLCGEPSQRLVGRKHFQRAGRFDVSSEIEQGICAICRTKYKLP